MTVKVIELERAELESNAACEKCAGIQHYG